MILKICVEGDNEWLSFLPLLIGWHHEIDIQKTIQLVRTQRSSMVQTEVRVAHNSEVIIAVLSWSYLLFLIGWLVDSWYTQPFPSFPHTATI